MSSDEVKAEKINLRKYAAPLSSLRVSDLSQKLRREKCVHCEKMMNIGEMRDLPENPKLRMKLNEMFGRKFEKNCERSKMPLICKVHLEWVDLDEMQRLLKVEEEEEAKKRLEEEEKKSVKKINERKRNAIKIRFRDSPTTLVQKPESEDEDPEERERIQFFMEKRQRRLEQENEKETAELSTNPSSLKIPPNSRCCKLCGEWEFYQRTIELPRDLSEVSQVLGPIYVDFHPGYICESHVDDSLLKIVNRQKAIEALEEQRRIGYYMEKRKQMLQQKLMMEMNIWYCKYCKKPEELKNLVKLPVKTNDLLRWAQVLEAPQLFTPVTKKNQYICRSHVTEDVERYLLWEEEGNSKRKINVIHDSAPTPNFFCKVCHKREEDITNFLKLPEEVSELWKWSQILKASQLITSRIDKNHAFICKSHINEDFARYLQLRKDENTIKSGSGECSTPTLQNVTLHVTDYVENDEDLPINIIETDEDSAKDDVGIEEYQLFEEPNSSSKVPISGCEQEVNNEDFKEEEIADNWTDIPASLVETEVWQ